MIKRYRTKPVEIEAVQWTGINPKEIEDFTMQDIVPTLPKNDQVVLEYKRNPYLIIHTLEGDMKADKGDYIIKGLRGEFYPCKPDVFEKKYEEIKPPKFQAEYAECNICDNYQPSPYLDYASCIARDGEVLYGYPKQDKKIHCGKFKTKEGYKME
ncbi:hypothetical protein [Anaerofustis stercorihominis]|uniref:hypothetical protein n=1 Tax=Anaerofustis stercorihominis TaxID=214853 RepID=UPI002688242F